MKNTTIQIFAVLSLAWGAGCQMAMPEMSFLPANLGQANTKSDFVMTRSGVTVRGPKGYCVDPASTKEDASISFALLANCKALKGRNVPRKDLARAFLTVSISGVLPSGIATDMSALEAFFTSETGQGIVARSADAQDVTIQQVASAQEAIFLHVTDTSPNPLGALSQSYWRGITVIAGRLVTVTAASSLDTPVSEQALREKATEFMQSMLDANRDLPEDFVSQ